MEEKAGEAIEWTRRLRDSWRNTGEASLVRLHSAGVGDAIVEMAIHLGMGRIHAVDNEENTN